MPRSPGRGLVLLSPVLLTPRSGSRPARGNWQNNSGRAALPRARPSPAGASVPAAETNSHNTPNKSSQLRPPESLSAAGSAPPEPARTVSERGSPCSQRSCARPPAPPPARGAARPPRTPLRPRARPAPHRPPLRARPRLSLPPPARLLPPPTRTFFLPNFYPNFQEAAPRGGGEGWPRFPAPGPEGASARDPSRPTPPALSPGSAELSRIAEPPLRLRVSRL